MPSENQPLNTLLGQLNASSGDAVRVTITPDMAVEILELNKINRPLRQETVNRIARQIAAGKWRYNGETIKITHTLDVLDGQHRLWAIIEAKRAVETLVAFGIDREAFETIDTLRANRTLGDTIALEGQLQYRNYVGQALAWLIRYERGTVEKFRAPSNRIENADVKEAFRANPNIVHAVQQGVKVRKLVNASLVAVFYYVLANQNTALADQMIEILRDPSKTKVANPFYLLRHYLVNERTHKDPVKVLALMVKAANAAYAGKELTALEWRPQGKNPERFPILAVRNLRKGADEEVA